jgi:hypothetical protein
MVHRSARGVGPRLRRRAPLRRLIDFAWRLMRALLVMGAAFGPSVPPPPPPPPPPPQTIQAKAEEDSSEPEPRLGLVPIGAGTPSACAREHPETRERFWGHMRWANDPKLSAG